MRVRVDLNKDWIGRWLPVAIWMALIYFLSAQPTLLQLGSDWLQELLNIAGHLIEYFVLGYLLAHALDAGDSRSRLVSAVFLAMLYAIGDEWHQSFVPGRDASVFDLAMDALGASLGVLIFFHRRKAIEWAQTLNRKILDS